MDQKQLRLLLEEIEKKNSWGKNELKDLILKILSGQVDKSTEKITR
jgi:hypothetical protein